MQDRVVIQAIAREKHADAGLRAVVAAAELIELFHGFARIGGVAEFQIRFGKQVKILRLVGMLGDFVGDLFNVEFGSVVFGEIRARADVIEKILIRIRAWCLVLGERLKNAEVARRGLVLVKVAFDHGELVVTGGGLVTHFDVLAKERRGFVVFFGVDAEIREFEQGFGHVGLVAQRLLESPDGVP